MPQRPFLSEVEAPPSLSGMLPAVDHADLPVLGRSGGWDLPVNQVKSMNEINKSETKRRIAVMQAWVDGRAIQIRDSDGSEQWTDYASQCQPQWDWADCDYRIKPLEFPKLPDGLEWHNPEGLTPEQVGSDRRLLVKGELDGRFSSGSNEHRVSWWSGGEWRTTSRAVGATGSYNTYSVPLSTPFPEPPKPKVMVPLEPHDISPTDVLRQKDRQYPYHEHWMKIDAVNCDGPAVHFPGMGRIRLPFKDLASHWEISRDGAKTWKPCEKESAS